MKATCAQPGANVAAASGGRWLWVLAGLLVCLVAVSGDSLWIDEALSANEVSHASFGGMWHMLTRDRGSDLQMPLYIFHLWAWVKILGTSEWALRAINIPWFLLAVAACAAAFAGRKRTGLMVAMLISPFTWYFLNEARPYAMQISTSLIAFAGLYRLAQDSNQTPVAERRWVGVFGFGVVCLSASSLLGMIWAGGFLLAAWWCLPWQRLRKLASTHAGLHLLSAILLLITGIYYLWTLAIGARATAGTTDLRNLFFIGYELLGFGGLGPGRLEIRGGTVGSFWPYATLLAIFGGLLIFVGLAGMKSLVRRFSARQFFGIWVVIALPGVLLVVAGYALQFRVLERHFAPLIVVVGCVVAAGIVEGWRRGGVAHWMVCAFVILCVASCLEVRFAPSHKKDDYRDAAAYAGAALGRGERVWWNAEWHGAVYYHLPLGTNSDDRTEALWVLNSTPAAPPTLSAPDIVISSKPDIFDQDGAVGDFLRKGPYAEVTNYAAFSVWRRKMPPGREN